MRLKPPIDKAAIRYLCSQCFGKWLQSRTCLYNETLSNDGNHGFNAAKGSFKLGIRTLGRGCQVLHVLRPVSFTWGSTRWQFMTESSYYNSARSFKWLELWTYQDWRIPQTMPLYNCHNVNCLTVYLRLWDLELMETWWGQPRLHLSDRPADESYSFARNTFLSIELHILCAWSRWR